MPETSSGHRLRTGLLLATLVPSFYLVEWLLVAGSATFFGWLHYRGISTGKIWLLLWAGNLVLSTGFILCNDLLRVDLTLMQGLRSVTDATIRRSRWPGLLLEAIVCLRLLLWDGPCQLLIFLRRRLQPRWARISLMLAASAFQMWVWATLYSLGYDSIGDLLGH